MDKFIYADNAATTRVSESVLRVSLPYFREGYGNPSSIYKLGRDAQKAVEDSRAVIAEALGCLPEEIFFTSGGSESNNWAIKSACEAGKAKGKNHIVTTVFEHHAVLHTCEALENQGFDVTYIPIDEKGYISPEDVKNAIRPETAIVTVMFANNEIGTIQPIAEIGKICRESGVLFHTDAVQAIGSIDIKLNNLDIDMLSLSGHKIHAQKGIGVLYIRKGIKIPNLIYGGGQESTRRAGTENVPAIVGLAKAVEEITAGIADRAAVISKRRNRLIEGLLKITHSRLNGGLDNRLCGNVNISFEGIEGESLLLMLDNRGICASSGSACTSGSLDPSHVLLALGLKHEVAHGSLRLSINEETSDEDVEYIIQTVPEVVDRLRAMSPLWEKIVKEEGIDKS